MHQLRPHTRRHHRAPGPAAHLTHPMSTTQQLAPKCSLRAHPVNAGDVVSPHGFMEPTWATPRAKKGQTKSLCTHRRSCSCTSALVPLVALVDPGLKGQELCCLHCLPRPGLCGSLLIGVPGMKEESAETAQESQKCCGGTMVV